MKNIQKTYRHVGRKALFSLFLSVSVLWGSSARADAWGANVMAANMLFSLTQIAEEIKGVTLSIVKNVALQTINQQVLGMVNGTWGEGSLVIEDWENFIYTQSSQKAEDVVLNDFFPRMFHGKGSGGNYMAASEGVGVTYDDVSPSINTIKNYPEYLSKIGKNTLENLKSDVTEYTLDQVCPDPQGSLSRGDYACFSAIMEPQNNPRGIPILTEEKYVKEKEQSEKIAETQAGITGYKPQTNSNGLVVTPPQTIADIVSTVQTLPAMALAVAENPAELVTGVIQVYVNSLIQKTLSKVGLGSVDAAASRDLGEAISRETDALISDNVGALFNGDGVGTDIVGPNNVGSTGTASSSPNLDNSQSGPNWRYVR